VIHVDAALRVELLEVAIRQPEAEIPVDRQQDHLGRESETHELRQIKRTHWTTARLHHRTIADRERSVNATVLPMNLGVAGCRDLRRRGCGAHLAL
jgi:hypothetical protein